MSVTFWKALASIYLLPPHVTTCVSAHKLLQLLFPDSHNELNRTKEFFKGILSCCFFVEDLRHEESYEDV